MKKIIESIIIAFSMYSALPMPKTGWDKENMKYSLCFFPFVGVLISLAMCTLFYEPIRLALDPALFAAIAILIPLIITGGIHVDGFIDTCDAVSSRQDIAKKLEILKDPHVGAFGVIYAIAYFLLMFGLFTQSYGSANSYGFPTFIIAGYFISRCLSVLSLLIHPCAKDTGLAYIFADGSNKKNVSTIIFLYLMTSLSFLVYFERFYGLLIFFLCFLILFIYKRYAVKYFGGITGDLAGFLLIIIELFFLMAQCIGGVL